MNQDTILKIIIFVLVNVAGFYITPLAPNLAGMIGVLPEISEEKTMLIPSLKNWMFGGGMWVWMICALLSTGYFFIQGALRYWLIALPLVVPALYQIFVLARFNALAAG